MLKFRHFLTNFAIVAFLASCETGIDNPDLLDSVTPGQMAVVVNNGTKKVMSCEYNTPFSSGFKGEVIVQGEITTATGFEFLSISFGSNINETPLSAGTYVTNVASDKISVKSSYGDSSESAVLEIVYENVSPASIIGTFSGKLDTGAGLVNVKGAFWATPGQSHSLIKRKIKNRD